MHIPKLRESPEKARFTRFKAAVAKYLALRGMTKENLISSLHMSRTSFWEKMNNPDNFRVGELRQLYSLLNFDDDDKDILI